MSFADQIILKNAANADVTFQRIGMFGGNLRYLDLASTTNAPREIIIGHQMGSSASAVDRHLLKVSLSALDAGGKAFVETWNVTRSTPRNGVITTAMSKDAVALISNFLANATLFDKMARGEY